MIGGDRGDVGIIRSPVRASILPDPCTQALDWQAASLRRLPFSVHHLLNRSADAAKTNFATKCVRDVVGSRRAGTPRLKICRLGQAVQWLAPVQCAPISTAGPQSLRMAREVCRHQAVVGDQQDDPERKVPYSEGDKETARRQEYDRHEKLDGDARPVWPPIEQGIEQARHIDEMQAEQSCAPHARPCLRKWVRLEHRMREANGVEQTPEAHDQVSENTDQE